MTRDEERFSIPYTVFPVRDLGWMWEHDVTRRSNSKLYKSKEAAERAAKSHFMQSRETKK